MSGKKDRQKMIRDAKNYQRKRKSAEERSRKNKSTNRNEAVKKPVKTRKNISVNIVDEIPSNEYNDGFYVDEIKARKEKAAKIEEQKNKNRKAPVSPKRRRAKHIITYVVIFSVIVIIGIVLCLTVLFKTEKINVEGNTLYDENQIISLSSVQMEENIFLAKFSATPEKIVAALPYIKEARVDFKIPDTITITVKNAEPAYVVVSNNQYYKVSDEGRILEATDQNIDNLPIIVCSDIKNTEIGKYIEYADENINKILKDINDCITENDYTDISYIDVRNPANISLVYDYRIKIIIGLPEDISYKLKTAMTIIKEKLDQNGAIRSEGTLDVSSCNSTKKSYFKDGKINLEIAAPTEATQPETTQPDTQPETVDVSDDSYTWQPSDNGGYSSDNSDYGYWNDYSDGNYSDGSYSDGYSDGDYSDGNYSDGYSDGNYSDGNYSDGYSDGNYNDGGYSDGYSDGDYSGGDGSGYYSGGDYSGDTYT